MRKMNYFFKLFMIKKTYFRFQLNTIHKSSPSFFSLDVTFNNFNSAINLIFYIKSKVLKFQFNLKLCFLYKNKCNGTVQWYQNIYKIMLGYQSIQKIRNKDHLNSDSTLIFLLSYNQLELKTDYSTI